MGFSSGASSAERKAKKKAATAYYAAFSKLQALPELERISTSNKRDIEDSIGDSASFRTRNMSQKADRVARQINNDDDYKKKVSAYNDRYAILKDQIANKSTVRYSISDKPSELPVIKSDLDASGNWAPHQTSISGAGDYATPSPQAPKNSSFATKGSMFKNQEEAMAGAAKSMEDYNNSLGGLLGAVKRIGQYNMPERYTQKDLDAMRVSDPSRFIQEEKFDGFGVLYRNLSKAESAANDINALGNNVTSSKGNANVTAYSELANKLKPLIKKDANNMQPVTNGGSIVSSELASANPYTETIAS